MFGSKLPSTSHNYNFSNLPPELVLLISSFLDSEDIGSLKSISHFFYTTLNEIHLKKIFLGYIKNRGFSVKDPFAELDSTNDILNLFFAMYAFDQNHELSKFHVLERIHPLAIEYIEFLKKKSSNPIAGLYYAYVLADQLQDLKIVKKPSSKNGRLIAEAWSHGEKSISKNEYDLIRQKLVQEIFAVLDKIQPINPAAFWFRLELCANKIHKKYFSKNQFKVISHHLSENLETQLDTVLKATGFFEDKEKALQNEIKQIAGKYKYYLKKTNDPCKANTSSVVFHRYLFRLIGLSQNPLKMYKNASPMDISVIIECANNLNNSTNNFQSYDLYGFKQMVYFCFNMKIDMAVILYFEKLDIIIVDKHIAPQVTFSEAPFGKILLNKLQMYIETSEENPERILNKAYEKFHAIYHIIRDYASKQTNLLKPINPDQQTEIKLNPDFFQKIKLVKNILQCLPSQQLFNVAELFNLCCYHGVTYSRQNSNSTELFKSLLVPAVDKITQEEIDIIRNYTDKWLFNYFEHLKSNKNVTAFYSILLNRNYGRWIFDKIMEHIRLNPITPNSKLDHASTFQRFIDISAAIHSLLILYPETNSVEIKRIIQYISLNIFSVTSQALDELRLHIFFTPFASTWNTNDITELKENMKANRISYLYGTFCSLLRNGFLQIQDFLSITSFEIFKKLMEVYDGLVKAKLFSNADFHRFCVDFSFQKEIADLINDKLKAAASQLEVVENGESPSKKQRIDFIHETDLDEPYVNELGTKHHSVRMA